MYKAYRVRPQGQGKDTMDQYRQLPHSPVVLEFDLKLIARKPFSTASYTEKYALQHTESPKESSEGKAWKMSHTVSKFIRIISININ